jgi:hypothetical protein
VVYVTICKIIGNVKCGFPRNRSTNEKNAYRKASELVIFAKYNWTGQVKGCAMGRACSKNKGRVYVFGGKAVRKDTIKKTKALLSE